MGRITLIRLVIGVMTGVAGGLLRDFLCGEIPSVFQACEFHASAAMSGAVTIVGLCLAALRSWWRLPVLETKSGG